MNSILSASLLLCPSIFLFLNTNAIAQDTYLTFNIGSYHVNAEKKYNQKNYGLGVEHHIGDFSLSGGIYYNSYYRTSLYTLGGWTPLEVAGVKVGILAGVANGYPGMNASGPIFVAAVILSTEYVNILVVPSNGDKTPLTVGFQVKWRL